MKTKIYLSVLIFGLFFTSKAQVVLYEGFSAPFNPPANGWDVQNLSSPVGSNSWFQGSNAFNALAGGAADYFAVNFNSTSALGANNTISNWLITPTLNLVNGAVVQFATRTTAPASGFADRLQLYYSTAGNGTDVGLTAGTATNTAGTFTNIVLDINSNEAAMGYPDFWIVITATLNGIATPTVGRLAFRYYLTNAGASGINGNFVAIDEFRYSMPCPHTPVVAAWNGALCSGNSVTLSIMGATNPITSYTWMTGANTGTTAVVPVNSGMNTVHVLLETTPGCLDLEVANMNVLPSPTVSVAFAPTGNICSGSTVTLSATGANSYTYILNPATTSTLNPTTMVAPTVTNMTTASFTVRGRGANNCVNMQTLQLTIHPNPTLSTLPFTSQLCIGKTAALGATGAVTYTWSGTGSSAANPYNYTATAPAGVKSFTLKGTSAEGCESAPLTVTLTVNACTGIDDVSNSLNTISVYPNPFNDQLLLKGFTGHIKICDELGRLVLEADILESEVIDTKSLRPGFYILKTSNSTIGQSSVRLIKN